MMQEEHKGYSATLTEFNKPVIGYQAGEVIFEVNTNVLIIKELEVTEAS